MPDCKLLHIGVYIHIGTGIFIMKKIKFLFLALRKIASANPDGFTVDSQSLTPITAGYAVAVAATQNSFGQTGLQRVIRYIRSHSSMVNAVGGWLDSESGHYYYDATIVVENLADAFQLARRNRQRAFYDLTNNKTIYIN